jgi:pimeloyl-ACP methyl ester carboxylesterase
VSERESFTAPAPGGSLGGFLAGSGAPVLALHGGPGVSFAYLDGLVDELADGFRVALYQQRGLEPSTLEGPFTIAQAIDDAVAVLDALEWPRALVVGHAWGGHLALRLLAARPERLLGVLAVDPLGIVGDGGMAAFEAELVARTPRAGRLRAQELDERAIADQGTPEETMESLSILWPYYFADPENAPAMRLTEFSVEAFSGLITEVGTGLDQVADELATTSVPLGCIAGAGSPIPWGQAARASAELSPQAFLEVVPDAGHFIWIEAPGRVREALLRLGGT